MSGGQAAPDTRRHPITAAPYTIQTVDADRRSTTGSAETLNAALDAAWHLNRYTEGDVEIIDNFPYNEETDEHDGPPRQVAIVSVTFTEED